MEAWRPMLEKMVDRLVAEGHPRSAEVEAAFRKVPRVALEKVYSGVGIPTKLGERGLPLSSSSEPAIMARMVERWTLSPGSRSSKLRPGRATTRPFWPSWWVRRAWW